jgi:hypothetical protein
MHGTHLLFHISRSWLGELASNSSNLDHRDTSAKHDDYRHLKQHPVEIPDPIGIELSE